MALMESRRNAGFFDHWASSYDRSIHQKVMFEPVHEAALDGTIYYGLRAYGPNWPWTASFVPGTEIGFVSDSGYYRHARGSDCPRHDLLVERPEVLD